MLRAIDSRGDKTDVCNLEQETDNEVFYFSIFIQKYQNLALLVLYKYIRKFASMKKLIPWVNELLLWILLVLIAGRTLIS